MDIWFTLFVTLAAVLVAVGGALLLVSYLQILPASFDHGWRTFLLTLLLPIIGPLWFARKHRSEFERPGKQMLVGALLLACVVLMLLFWGPYFVERVVATIKIKTP
jgi:putative copper export protein